MYWPQSTTPSVLASWTPSHAVWLKDLSSTLPTSVTRPTQNTPDLPQSAADLAAGWQAARTIAAIIMTAISNENFLYIKFLLLKSLGKKVGFPERDVYSIARSSIICNGVISNLLHGW